MRFDHLTLDDGLSQSNVLSILQDSDGLMWFGTENGLNSYNGYDFTHYRRQRGNPRALASDFIFDVAEDGDGQLWIATNGGGLAKLDRKTGHVNNWRHEAGKAGSVSSNVIRRVLIDDAGHIWLGTRGAGLDRFDPKTGTAENFDFNRNADGTFGTIFALYQDATGQLWVGGDHGLTRLDPDSGKHRTFRHDKPDPSTIGAGSVRAIASDEEGRLWVGTFGGGLSRFDASSQTFKRFGHSADDPSTISGDQVATIFRDDAGRLWVGTTTGLNLVDSETGNAVRYVVDNSDAYSLGDNNITTIYQDRSGLLWIGTKWRGLNKWNPRTWYYGFEPAKAITATGKSEPNVMGFVEDEAGALWIATFGEGLNVLNRDSGAVTKYRSDAAGAHRIDDDRVMSLMRDRDGRIWVGTMTSGITRIDPVSGERTEFRYEAGNPASLSANGIMTMYEDSAGQVWVGTFGGGISRFDPESESFTRMQAVPGDPSTLGSNRVTAFAEDPSGRMWVGTDSGGLNLYDPKTKRFHQFRHDPQDPATLAADTVYSISVDAAGNVWVGTHGGGLDRVVGSADEPKKITFDNTSQQDGLANDVVYGVQVDTNGSLWLSTNYGISRVDPQNGEIRNLHRKDGLQSEEFNFGAHYQSDSGELFFGGHNGFNAFHPDEIKPGEVAPLIALTGLFNFGDRAESDLPMDDSGGVEISWKDDVVAFEFAALDYTAPEQNRYMYKLEGFDRDWIDLGNERRVTYTDLDDGRYLLRVRAANSDGVWNEAGFTVPLRVTAAPWDTWWAYLGYAALFANIVLGLWFSHRNKIRREEEYSRRLELEVNARTEKLLDKNQQLRVLNRALQESSLSDPLTGLRNRRFVFEEVSRDLDVIQRRLAEERDGVDSSDVTELVFMMIDLDNFKPINDTYGHAAGDQMLIELRDVLLDICRRSDFVIRWGGDEFVVIAKQTRPEEAEALAERIRASVANHNFSLADGQIVRTTCSIGFAAYPLFKAQADDSSLDQIISLADGLMYEAKKKRNAWVGMLGPSEATTSFEFDHDSIESTSLLFRARRAGNLSRYSLAADERDLRERLQSAS
ncbi:MAG: two-component regulator propeller domain-containing protein [Woeseiaceae bacterium]|nr:two-component regulator propeller domain-containing protein [Woeseiaceae bacterium]